MNIETLIAKIKSLKNSESRHYDLGVVFLEHYEEILAALRQQAGRGEAVTDQSNGTAKLLARVKEEIISLRLPDCQWEKKYVDRFDDGVRAAIHKINALMNDEEVERYECPIHGLQDGPDCPRC